jgi:3-deoxy-D-manno-octulosonic-acid transferase
MFLYRLAQWIVGLAAVPVMPVLVALNAWNLRKSWKHRLGFLPEMPSQEGRPRIWFHAASVGEVSAVAPLISSVRQKCPSACILMTTITDAGLEMARRLRVEADLFGHLPLELPGCAWRAVKRIRPHLCVVVETEIWPDFLHSAASSGARLMLVNGRISSTSLRKYRLILPLFRAAVNQFHVLSMRTESDAKNMEALGIDPSHMVVTGNLKHEYMLNRVDPALAQSYRRRLGWGPEREILVAGSTRQGEEKMVVRAFRRMKEERPGLSLLLAPRHIQRVRGVAEMIRQEGLRVTLLSFLNDSEDPDPDHVVLVDTIGDLFGLYGIATLVFCGGSLVRRGGQNIFEPAAWGKVVLHGPHMDNFLEEKEALERAGASFTVHNEDQMASAGLDLLRDPLRLEKLGDEATRVVRQCAGATQKNLALIRSLLAQAHTG